MSRHLHSLNRFKIILFILCLYVAYWRQKQMYLNNQR